MLKHRCPWCGELLDNKLPNRWAIWQYFSSDLCPYCQKPYLSRLSWQNIVVLATALVLLETIRRVFLINSKFHSSVLLIELLLLCFSFIKMYQLPFKRGIDKNEPPLHKMKCKARAFIKWDSKKKGGLLFPRMHFENGEIIPACFMDKEGSPISDALCVMLENLHWSGIHRCTCHISLVLDDVPTESLFLPGNQFYLYHNKKQIAKGTIEKIK